MPNVELYQNCTPILVDDIISTAATMIETVNHLKLLKMKPPICIGIHALFSGHAYEDLLKTSANIVTANTIAHVSNQIDLKDMIIQSIDSIFN